jgi:hypothetical protein
MSGAQDGHRRSVTARRLAVAALLLGGSLAACAPAGTGLQQDAGRQLQQRVVGVSQAAAGNDPTAGLAALDGLESDLAAAVGNGQVSENRRLSIMTAAAAVRADLAALKAQADAAAAKSAEDAAAAQKQAEAAAQTAPAPGAPAPAPAGGKGKGKNNN